MLRYYFHVRRGQMTFLDREGLACADLEEVAREADRRAWEIEAREAQANLPARRGIIIVEDEFSRVLEVPFGGIRLESAATATLATLR